MTERLPTIWNACTLSHAAYFLQQVRAMVIEERQETSSATAQLLEGNPQAGAPIVNESVDLRAALLAVQSSQLERGSFCLNEWIFAQVGSPVCDEPNATVAVQAVAITRAVDRA
jgi:hypothetical protein